MKTTAFCPISTRKIDDHVARLNGGFTILILALFVYTGSILPILFLLADFVFRSGKYSRFSLLANLSKSIAKLLQLKPALINAGSKIFAARIGLVFNVSIILSYLFGLNNLSIVITLIFGTCAFLESVVGFCVACQFYPFVYRFTFHSNIQKLKI